MNRQSSQDFARWGHALGAALGVPLELSHEPASPRAQDLRLISRRDFGAAVDAPTAILRFALPRSNAWQRLTGRGFARFRAGDLLGVEPKGATGARLYSLASSSRDGFVEIVVKHQPGGLCSGQLVALQPGETIRAFLRPNPTFHPARGRKPLILIGAGTGIGPLAGFIRDNRARRPVTLVFGLRHPDSDFLYQDELADWQADGRLTTLVTAASRTTARAYVQDALRTHAPEVTRALAQGGQVMVCGGRDMAEGVKQALSDILAPQGLGPATLKSEGRYVEDIY